MIEKENIEFDDWPFRIGITAYRCQSTKNTNIYIFSYCNYFVFSLNKLKKYKGKKSIFILKNSHLIFLQPY